MVAYSVLSHMFLKLINAVNVVLVQGEQQVLNCALHGLLLIKNMNQLLENEEN